MEPLRVEAGQILCYRLYDVAAEIDLTVAESLLAGRRGRLSRSGSQYLQLPNPPLVVGLGRRTLPLPGGPVEVEAQARLFDHGAVSILLRVPVPPGTAFDALTALAGPLYDAPEIDTLCHTLLEGLRKTVATAMESAHLWEQSESYSVVLVERFAGAPTGAEVLARGDLARLLLGESPDQRLSDE